jgi:enterochelin esterase-like enzyme
MQRVFAATAVALVWLVAPIEPAAAQGRLEIVQVPAPSLAGNRLGTASEQTAAVYLPQSYGRSSARRYPVIYLLHGIFDSHETWLAYVDIAERLDRLIAARRIPDVIVVMPDGFNIYGGGFYRNSPVSGNWGDFVTDDLVRFTDERYRTLARAGGRALAGWSMGGYGAIHLAMERPGLYSVVYAISPCCLAPVEDLGFGNDAWQRAYRFEGEADLQAAMEARDFYAVAGIGVLTAFSPAPEAAPFFVDFPFVIERGQVVPEDGVFDAYVARFPLSQVAQHRDALAGLRAFGMDYGVDDQYAHIPTATRQFSLRLSELRIPHRLEVYDGDHREHVAERLESIVLPFIASALDAPQ